MPKKTLLIPFIIALNILVFLMWNTNFVSENFMQENFLVSWQALQEGRFWTLLGSAFSHNSFMHILVNMFVLNSFGPLLAQVLGKKLFISFYMAAAALSSLCHAVVSNLLLHSPDLPALGASGAIAGLVLLFALIFPKERLLFFGFIPVPALVGALGFIALDLWGLFAQAEGGGLPIGHGAHLGGSFTGILFYFLFVRKKVRRHIDMNI